MRHTQEYIRGRLKILRHTFEKHERLFSIGAFFFGFIFDNLTLTRIDFWLDNLILFIYLVLAGATIFFVNAVEEGLVSRPSWKNLASWAPLIMQFAFGNLFSGYVVFYSRGAALAASWPFMVLLLFMFIGNEFFRKRYQRLGFQVSVFFLVLFSFTIFYVPIVVKEISARVFLLSGVVSLCVIALFLYLFSILMPRRFEAGRRVIVAGVGGIFLLITIFYFTNIIPPLPLSLKDVGVYHLVERVSEGDYRVVYEKKDWFAFLKPYDFYHHISDERVYVYSAVFAPTDLGTDIFHRWEYWNEKTGVWEESGHFKFPIYGGRGRGYRGYSFKTNVLPGYWRVDVMTDRGQLLGRIKFIVVPAGATEDIPLVEGRV